MKQDFFSLVEQQYGVRPKVLQGGNKDVKEINDWVARETSGKVQRLLEKPLPSNSGVNLVSAAYFKGRSTPSERGERQNVTEKLCWLGSVRRLRLRLPVCSQGSG